MLALLDADGAAVNANPTAYITITDNDAPEMSAYSFDKSELILTAGENNNYAEFSLERTGGIDHMAEVLVRTANVDCDEYVNYVPFNETITFAPGQQYQKIKVLIKQFPESGSFFEGRECHQSFKEVSQRKLP